MTNEDKELLLKDLFARMPHYVSVKILPSNEVETLYSARLNGGKWLFNDAYYLEEIKPCLRRTRDMTDKELADATKYMFNTDKVVYTSNGNQGIGFYGEMPNGHKLRLDETMFKLGCCGTKNTDWLNIHHFDYRDLINKGLALEVDAEFYAKPTVDVQ